MPFRLIRAQAQRYSLICAMLALSWYISQHFSETVEKLGIEVHSSMLLVLLSIVVVFALGFVVFELAKQTVIPSFVLAMLFGIVSRDVLAFVVDSQTSLTTLITIGAILILFGGGLDTPFSKFRQLFAPILSLALIGTVITGMLLSLVLVGTAGIFGVAMPVGAAVLLGAALASTDPAAIIPSFKSLLFTKPRVKYIAISESAINDVTGTVLTTTFLSLLVGGFIPSSVLGTYGSILEFQTALALSRYILVGFVVGVLGFLALHFWSKWKQRVQTEDDTDAALFLAVPIFAFAAADIFGGSGFLAVFIAGLLFHLEHHFRHVEHYFNHTIEGFMKPMIFMLLGAMVDIGQLAAVAPLGIAAGLLFMFVLRPLTVFATLWPFCLRKQCFSIRELLFLSFVRETGVIPAVLLITISLAGVPGSEVILAVGLWIIILTLVIEPPLTPLVAKLLKVAKDTPVPPKRKHIGPVAVLCSRGFSFPERMQTVVDWALQHNVENVALLHCPEERYSPGFVEDVRVRAAEIFKAFNERMESEGKHPMNFEFLCGPGMLQDNIESLIEEGDVAIIFVGSKMLDYRMDDVKRLRVPFYFMA